jgi:hypothetical protein
VQAALAAVQAALAGRLLETGAPRPATPFPTAAPDDRLLTAKQVAEIAGVTPKWLLRRPSLPFVKRLGPKTIRYSEAGLRRWLATRRA